MLDATRTAAECARAPCRCTAAAAAPLPGRSSRPTRSPASESGPCNSCVSTLQAQSRWNMRMDAPVAQRSGNLLQLHRSAAVHAISSAARAVAARHGRLRTSWALTRESCPRCTGAGTSTTQVRSVARSTDCQCAARFLSSRGGTSGKISTSIVETRRSVSRSDIDVTAQRVYPRVSRRPSSDHRWGVHRRSTRRGTQSLQHGVEEASAWRNTRDVANTAASP